MTIQLSPSVGVPLITQDRLAEEKVVLRNSLIQCGARILKFTIDGKEQDFKFEYKRHFRGDTTMSFHQMDIGVPPLSEEEKEDISRYLAKMI